MMRHRNPVERVMQDVRDGYRALRSTPVVTAVAILSLALGIGANTAIFSVLDTLLLRSLPVEAPRQLVILGNETRRRPSLTNPIWEQIRDRAELFDSASGGVFDGAFAVSSTRFNLAQRGQSEFVDGLWASGNTFDVLGVRAMLGRTFTARDDRPGGGPDGPVAVISHAFWQRRFGGAADAIGRSLTVERVPYTIVGVMPPGFFGVEVGRTFDIAVPIGTITLIQGAHALERRTSWWLRIFMRLKPDQSVETGTARMGALQPRIREAAMPGNWRPPQQESFLRETFRLEPAASGDSSIRGRYRRPLLTLMVVVGLVLLIACANLANLLLARASARGREFSVRIALGASRARIARQLLTESLLLAGAGALLGLVLAQWSSRLLVRQLSTATNTVFLDLSLDWRVLGFTAGVALVTAVLFGMAPALRATRVQPMDVLKAQGRGTIGGDGRFGAGSALIVVQVALSLVLVVAAGLFTRTFSSLAAVQLGFDSRPVLVASVEIPSEKIDEARRPELFRQLIAAAAAVPGASSAALSEVTPLGTQIWNNGVELLDGPPIPDDDRLAYFNMISPGWFETYGTPILAGRDFTDADTSGAPRVAIVNEAFVRRFSGGRNPIGMRVRAQGQVRLIVGYVRNAVYESLREPPPPTLYLPYGQLGQLPAATSVSVRAAGGPGGSPSHLIRPLAAALGRVHGDVRITFRPLADHVDATLIQERIVAALSAFFGALALLLAGLGLYGLASYAVSRRRTEIAIRMALGAAPAGVVGLVLRRVVMLIALGIIAGAAASLWASRFVSPLLFGLQPRDPWTLAAAIVLLAVIGVLAGWLPARRASRIDPARVLLEG